jgi:hypothetical protein
MKKKYTFKIMLIIAVFVYINLNKKKCTLMPNRSQPEIPIISH